MTAQVLFPGSTYRGGPDRFANDSEIMRLWARKLDTWQIAKVLKVPESTIANRLAQLREAAKNFLVGGVAL